MLKNYLKLAWKVLLRRKFFTFISLFGISFTLVVLMLATAHSRSRDRAVPARDEAEPDRRDLLRHDARRAGAPQWNGRVPAAGYVRARNLPNVEKLSIATFGGSAFSYVNGQRVKSYMKRTDGAFWEILDFQFLEGRPLHGRATCATGAWSPSSTSRPGGDSSDRRPRSAGRSKSTASDSPSSASCPTCPILRLVPFARHLGAVHHGEVRQPTSRSWSAISLGSCCCRIPRSSRVTRDEFWSRLRTIKPLRSDVPVGRGDAGDALRHDRPHVHRQRHGNGHRLRRRASMIALTVAAALFMLLPAVNLMNLNTSRILERASEIGVRKAFGASSRDAGWPVHHRERRAHAGRRRRRVRASPAWLLQAINASGVIQYADAAAELPHLRVGRCARGRVRPALGRLSRLAHVAAAPGAGVEGSVAMIRHLFKLIWNRKRTNLLMMAEIFVSFLVLFAVVGARRLHAGQLAAADRLFDRPRLGHRRRHEAGVATTTSMRRSRRPVRQLLLALGEFPEIEGVAGTMLAPYQFGSSNSALPVAQTATIEFGVAEVTDGFKDLLGLQVIEGRWFGPRRRGPGVSTPVVINQTMREDLFGERHGDRPGPAIRESARPGDRSRAHTRVVGVVDGVSRGRRVRRHAQLRDLSQAAARQTIRRTVRRRNLLIKVRRRRGARLRGAADQAAAGGGAGLVVRVTPLVADAGAIRSGSPSRRSIAVGLVAAFLMLMVALGLLRRALAGRDAAHARDGAAPGQRRRQGQRATPDSRRDRA